MTAIRTTEPTIINTFIGRLAAAPTMTRHGDTNVTRFVLIRNEYAGKDSDSGEIRVRKVALPLTAFNGQAKALGECAAGRFARGVFDFGRQLCINAFQPVQQLVDVAKQFRQQCGFDGLFHHGTSAAKAASSSPTAPSARRRVASW